jgi:hypothetical protein
MRWLALLRDMRIGGRLGAGFAVLIVLMVALVAVGMYLVKEMLPVQTTYWPLWMPSCRARRKACRRSANRRPARPSVRGP